LRTLQAQHQQLREGYLESLAEAIVLQHSPLLSQPSMSSVREERVEKQLKQLISREKRRKMYRKLGVLLNGTKGKGLRRIDVPDESAVSATSGDPKDPKSWRGPWRSVTNPTEIAREVCKVNLLQYNQAQHTPFGSGPLADLLGCTGETAAAQQLLQGQLPRNIPPDTLPETVRILASLAQQTPSSAGSVTVSEEEFVQTYTHTKESTSSSPSGRHIGHYIAATKDAELTKLHASMMSIPFQAGFAPSRWNKVTDIMLEKEENNPHSHRLRILALFESDLNHANRVIIGRQLMHHLFDNKMLPEMQHGSVPGKQCLSAVLLKVLSHNYLRVTETAGAVIENDAVGCYDHLVNNLVLMLLTKLGLPKSVTQCIGQLWGTVVHLIKTIYGISSVTYGNTRDQPLYGPGQGSTCGPLFWLLCYWVIGNSLDPSITPAKFYSVCKEVILETTGVSFVDDTSLIVISVYTLDPTFSDADNTRQEAEALITKLTTLSQHWERLLFSTGGAINLQKSHWYLVSWLWKNGIPKISTNKQLPGKLFLTSGYKATKELVPRMEPRDGFRTLGVHLSPSGNQLLQEKTLHQKAEKFCTLVHNSALTPSEAYCCYMQYIRPSLTYPLPCTMLTHQQCRRIQAPVLEAILPKMHLNRHTLHAILFAGPRYGGIEFPDKYTDMGHGQLRYFLGHLKLGDEVGKLLLALVNHTQLQVGSHTPFFKLPYPSFTKLIDHTWVTSIWKFTHQAQLTVEVEHQWVPSLARQQDAALMDVALQLNFSTPQLVMINMCCLHLQVLTISDVTTARGTDIIPSALKGEIDNQRDSSLFCPKVPPRPPPHFWPLWGAFLHALCHGTRLIKSLGSWQLKPHQQWRWYTGTHNIVYYRDPVTGLWSSYVAQQPSGRRTRAKTLIYQLGECSDPPDEEGLVPVSITYKREGFFTKENSANSFPHHLPAQPCNLWSNENVPVAFEGVPPFYQHLLHQPPTEEQCQDIANELENDALVACSDGAYDKNKSVASHGWVIASGLVETELAGGSVPVDGHPDLLSSYRAELSGIVALLYIIYCICQHYSITSGKVKLYCDNKGALRNFFAPIPSGITPYLTADHDLIELAHHLIQLIPLTIATEWVKGHFTGKNRRLEHNLNDRADGLAGDFQRNPGR